MSATLPWLPMTAGKVCFVLHHTDRDWESLIEETTKILKPMPISRQGACALVIPNPQSLPGAQKLARVLQKILSRLESCELVNVVENGTIYIFCATHSLDLVRNCPDCSWLITKETDSLLLST